MGENALHLQHSTGLQYYMSTNCNLIHRCQHYDQCLWDSPFARAPGNEVGALELRDGIKVTLTIIKMWFARKTTKGSTEPTPWRLWLKTHVPGERPPTHPLPGDTLAFPALRPCTSPTIQPSAHPTRASSKRSAQICHITLAKGLLGACLCQLQTIIYMSRICIHSM